MGPTGNLGRVSKTLCAVGRTGGWYSLRMRVMSSSKFCPSNVVGMLLQIRQKGVAKVSMVKSSCGWVHRWAYLKMSPRFKVPIPIWPMSPNKSPSTVITGIAATTTFTVLPAGPRTVANLTEPGPIFGSWELPLLPA